MVLADVVERVARKPSAPSPPVVKRKRSALAMSDDEDDEEVEQEFQTLSDYEAGDDAPTTSKAKPSKRGPKAPATRKKAIDEDEEMQVDGEGGEEEDEEEFPKPQRKKREKKPAVPVGRNGLKKRKVQKTRVITDAKGYTRESH